MATLRVVVDARIPDGLYGGVQQWVIGLANALSALEADAEEYLFLVDPGQHRWLEPYVFGSCQLLIRRPTPFVRRVTRIPRAKLGSLVREVGSLSSTRVGGGRASTVLQRLSVPRSDGTIEKAGVDIVHFPHQGSFLTSIPSIYQPWDLQHVHLPMFFTPEQRAWRELTYRAFCHRAVEVIAPSVWVKRDLINQYGLPPQKIGVINVPPPTAAYRDPTPDQIESIAARLRLPQRFIYYPAQLWPHKNHLGLLEALGHLRDQGITVPLVCSGHRNERHAELLREAATRGIGDDVQFLGFLDPADVQVLYRRARALIFPSLYEGWGMPVLEAFDAGLPVACSNVTSLPELVGDAALMFDPYDSRAMASAIQRLWTDDELAISLARSGRAVVARYQWRQTALAMRAHYRRVAGRRLSDEDLEFLAAKSSV